MHKETIYHDITPEEKTNLDDFGKIYKPENEGMEI